MINKPSGWWLVLQAGAIVLSILLAFGLEAWWEERQDEERTRQLLLVLIEELAENMALAEESVRFYKAKNDSAKAILRLASEDKLAEVSESEFDGLLNDLTWWQDSQFATGALNSIIYGAGLAEIENDELRIRIASWQDDLDFVSQIERQDYETYQNQLLPYLQSHTNLQQIANAIKQRPGGNSEGFVSDDALPQRGQRDHRYLLEDDTFLSLVTNTYWNGVDGVQFIGVFLNDAEQLSDLVKSSLD